jgi:hypothetical protein
MSVHGMRRRHSSKPDDALRTHRDRRGRSGSGGMTWFKSLVVLYSPPGMEKLG